MSDNIFNFKLYQNFSLDWINLTVLFFIINVFCSNLAIYLSKISSSGLVNEFQTFIEDILNEIFTSANKSYDPYNNIDRDVKIEQVFSRFLDTDKNFLKDPDGNLELPDKIKMMVSVGSTRKIKFDLVKNKENSDYYLVYYKINASYIENYLKSLYFNLKNKSNFALFFYLSFIKFKLLSIKTTNYFNYFFSCISYLNDIFIILFFCVPNILYLIYGILSVGLGFGFFCYYIIYSCLYSKFWFLSLYNLLLNIFNKATEYYINNIKTFGWIYVACSWWAGIIIICLIIWLCLLYISFMIFCCILMVFFYGFIGIYGFFYFGILRLCMLNITGYFVESCESGCDCNSHSDCVYKGDQYFNVFESIKYTFFTYTILYYIIYIICLNKAVYKSFGLNSIVLYIIIAAIFLYFLYKKLFKNNRSTSSKTSLVDDMNKDKPFGQAIFSYLTKGFKTTKT